MDGYISYTIGSGGSWIAWHTESKPLENATGRDLAASQGVVQFAIGPNPQAALANLQLEMEAKGAKSAKAVSKPKKERST